MLLVVGIGGCAAPESAVVEIRTYQTGCCYMEGSLHFGRLDGPTSGELPLEGGTEERGGLDDRRLIGTKTLQLAPGHYQIAVWERVCNGWCGMLSDPSGQATADFDLEADEQLSIAVDFVLLEGTTIRIGD
jgi:hypothetical protein